MDTSTSKNMNLFTKINVWGFCKYKKKCQQNMKSQMIKGGDLIFPCKSV